jgi:hypothetical protein
MIDVVAGPSVDRRFEVDGQWTPDAVEASLGSFYEERTPLRDGYAFRGSPS